jgi:hypothetical protein
MRREGGKVSPDQRMEGSTLLVAPACARVEHGLGSRREAITGRFEVGTDAHSLHDRDYADTPASPPSHPRPSPAAHASSAGSNKARPNPFANFGRFGVDGGLEGEKPEVGKRRDGAPHLGATANGVSLEGKSAAGRNVRQEGGAVEGKDRYGTSPTNGNMFERERERGDRMRARGPDTGALEPGSRSGATAAGTSARERREEVPKREGRAEEGGWRSVGGPGAYLTALVLTLC